jgi:hypothetical protein
MANISEAQIDEMSKELDAEQEARANFTPYKAVLKKEKEKICTVLFCDNTNVCEIVIDYEEKVCHTMLENLVPWASLAEDEKKSFLENNR